MRSKTFFVFGLVISIVLGASIRFLFSPEQLRYLVESQVSTYNPKAHIHFDQVELVLADGWVPRLGIRFLGLSLKSNDLCRSGNEFLLSDVYAPIDLMSLVAGQTRVGKIHIKEIRAELKPPTCDSDILVPLEESFTPPDPKAEDLESTVRKTVTTVVKKKELAEFRRFFKTRFSKELSNTRRWLGGVSIGKVLITDNFNKQKFSLENTDIEFDRADEVMVVESDLGYIIGDVKRNLPVQVTAEITSSKIQAKFDGNYREGDFELALDFNIPELEVQLKGEIKYVPFVQVMDAFDSTYLQRVEKTDGLRLMWVSCFVDASGRLLPLKDFELRMSECKLSGESAVVDFSEIKLYPLGKTPAAPFTGEIKKLALAKLITPLFSQNLKQQLINPGVFKGSLSYKTPDDIQLNGVVSKADVLFSRGGKRRIQRAESFAVELAFQNKRTSGLLKDIELLQGGIDGQMSFNFDQDLKNGMVQASFKSIELSKPIEQLLFKGELSGLALFGRGEVKDGNLYSWKGKLGFSELSSEELAAKGFKGEINFVKPILKSNLALEAVTVKPGSEVHSFLKPLFLFNDVSKQPLSLKGVQVSLEDSYAEAEQRNIWKKFKASVEKPKAVITSAGQLDKSVAKGWVSVDLPKLKLANWEVYGSSRKPQLSPTQDLLLRVAVLKRSTERTRAEEPERRVVLLNKILRKDNLSKLTELGKAVLSTAKSLTQTDEVKAESKKPKK